MWVSQLEAKKVLRDALEDQELRNSAKAGRKRQTPSSPPAERGESVPCLVPCLPGVALEHRDPLGLLSIKPWASEILGAPPISAGPGLCEAPMK